jgi:tetratricopeptide (TPR) repeat protein
MLLLALASAQAPAPYEVEVDRGQDEVVCTLTARGAPLGALLRELASCAGLELSGLDAESAARRVDVDLERRPIHDAAAILAGCADLRAEVRARSIAVERAAAPGDADALYDAALSAYLGALRAFPDHPLAPAAMQSEGRIEAARGHFAAARGHYEALLGRHPRASVAAPSRFELARISLAEERYELAAIELSDLLRVGAEPALENAARLALARCTAMLGEPARALYAIDALDSNAPGEDRVERELVRARSLAALGRGEEALAALERATGAGAKLAHRAEMTELRARACEAAGRLVDASSAWLALASIGGDNEEAPWALAEAARTALAAGDELGTLFIARRAAREGLARPELALHERTARERIGLDGGAASGATPSERIARAEALTAAGEARTAADALRSLDAEALDADTALRHALALASALEASEGVDAAVASLRAALPRLAGAAARRRVFVAAGEMLERADRLEAAIDAYEGKL